MKRSAAQRQTEGKEQPRKTRNTRKPAGKTSSVPFRVFRVFRGLIPCHGCTPAQIFATREQAGERRAGKPQTKRKEQPRNTRNTRKPAGKTSSVPFRVFRVFRGLIPCHGCTP